MRKILHNFWHVIFFVIIVALLGIGLVYSESTVSVSKKIELAHSGDALGSAIPVTRIQTPKSVQAVYATAWTVGTPTRRNTLVQFIESSQVNAIIIDIKDATGRISFFVNDPIITEMGSPINRIPDIREFIHELHEKDIYVIGRISVFQDPYLANLKPEWSIKNVSGGVWRDRGGLSFLNPASPEVADYTIRLARASYYLGFDEINFDYIRFPSDGDITQIDYPLLDGETRADSLESFFARLYNGLGDIPVATSADLFGMVTTSKAPYDLGIGQVLERALPYFDYISPMVYPSHYPPNYLGYANPAEHPYEIIRYVMTEGIRKTETAGYSKTKLRPWIQDFDLGASYGKKEVLDQIKALSELGLDSWMSWDPANRYTKDAYRTPVIAETVLQ